MVNFVNLRFLINAMCCSEDCVCTVAFFQLNDDPTASKCGVAYQPPAILLPSGSQCYPKSLIFLNVLALH
ncbi:hypothetical protein T10_6359 [Trichinella papuae]|uniref:Uncharacterized protein n=1 Tax=Trichinella papuae TaxID=268474 RepID=A0A0V1M3P8_9BILA|nr:hypothetical protein T10_6359 [Trichinella papuae]